MKFNTSLKLFKYLLPLPSFRSAKCVCCTLWIIVFLQVVRHYHGHLSACHAIDLHPTIDILATCGRDSSARVNTRYKKYGFVNVCYYTRILSSNNITKKIVPDKKNPAEILYYRSLYNVF